ncbi:phosphotransferase-like protein [Streptomyces chartreusis]
MPSETGCVRVRPGVARAFTAWSERQRTEGAGVYRQAFPCTPTPHGRPRRTCRRRPLPDGRTSTPRAGPGNRPSGLAAHQYELVHRHGDYALECDTGTVRSRECVQQVREFLPHRGGLAAFTRLRRRYLTDGK